ncbi:MAG: tetratricopeptide repeat protein, partial [Candidatus Anstonellales archaeon]
NLGNIMFYIDRKKAIEYYLKSIEINPRQVDARLNLGITYYLEGKLDLASEHFNEVLKIDPKNEKAIVYLKKMRE